MEVRAHEFTWTQGLSGSDSRNESGEPVNWNGAKAPEAQVLRGRTVRLEPMDANRHFRSLFEAATRDPTIWNYLSHGPFEHVHEFHTWLEWAKDSPDHSFFAVVDDATGRAEGMASYMREAPSHGVIEIGYIWFGLHLRSTTPSTEAIYLLLHQAFDNLSYRRVEWKWLIALYLLRQWTVPHTRSSLVRASSLPDQMDDVFEFIEKHLSEDLPVERLARIANFSPYYFARLFRKTAGQSPHQYIIGRRVERSRYLLLTTDWTLAAIAIETGFASGSHLAPHFKKRTEVLPRQYREEHGRTLESRSRPFQERGYYDGTQGSQ